MPQSGGPSFITPAPDFIPSEIYYCDSFYKFPISRAVVEEMAMAGLTATIRQKMIALCLESSCFTPAVRTGEHDEMGVVFDEHRG